MFLAAPRCLASPAPLSAKVRVVSSLQDFASIADSVGGDRVETFALARGYQDPHFVDAKPSFILKLSNADLLIVAGLELEIGYLPPLIDQSRNGKIHPGSPGYLDASIGCDILQRPTTQVTRAMGDVHPYGNPHYWTDPDNGRVIARAIAAKLSELDPVRPAGLREEPRGVRGEARGEGEGVGSDDGSLRGHEDRHLPRLLAQLRQALQARDRGHVEPKPGIPPTPSHTLEIINLIREEKIPVDPGRAVLRHEDPQLHRRPDRRGAS